MGKVKIWSRPTHHHFARSDASYIIIIIFTRISSVEELYDTIYGDNKIPSVLATNDNYLLDEHYR